MVSEDGGEDGFTRVQPPRRQRALPVPSTFDKATGHRAAAEISDLKKRLTAVTAELNKPLKNFTHKVGVHIRAGVRKARVATDVSLHLKLVKLKEELTFLRRASWAHTHNQKLSNEIASLQKKLAERYARISELELELAAVEKNEVLSKRRLANVGNTVHGCQAELKARKAELKKREKELGEQQAKLRKLEAKSQRLTAELESSNNHEKEREATLKASSEQHAQDVTRLKGVMESIEANCEEALLNMRLIATRPSSAPRLECRS